MAWKSNQNPMFRSQFSESIFKLKYAHTGAETMEAMATTVIDDVCGNLRTGEYKMMPDDELARLKGYIRDLKFVPGGRYLYYAGRKNRFYNTCFLVSSPSLPSFPFSTHIIISFTLFVFSNLVCLPSIE